MTTHKIEKYLHSIIDELHPIFEAISDEEMIENHEDRGVFTRDFHNKANGKKFRMKWCVYYGTPETVKTEFEQSLEIQ